MLYLTEYGTLDVAPPIVVVGRLGTCAIRPLVVCGRCDGSGTRVRFGRMIYGENR